MTLRQPCRRRRPCGAGSWQARLPQHASSTRAGSLPVQKSLLVSRLSFGRELLLLLDARHCFDCPCLTGHANPPWDVILSWVLRDRIVQYRRRVLLVPLKPEGPELIRHRVTVARSSLPPPRVDRGPPQARGCATDELVRAVEDDEARTQAILVTHDLHAERT